MPGRRIAVHGHRGARAALPENTLPAFAYAIDAGADYLELDVEVTRDGVLVVCHDPVPPPGRVLGPPGSRVVHELTLAQLRQFDCGSMVNGNFRRQAAVPGARIPTLDEVLALALRGSFRYNIEVKSFPEKPRYGPPPEVSARLLLEAVDRHGLNSRVETQSFDLRVLEALKCLGAPFPLTALRQFCGREFLRAARQAGATAIGPYHRLVTRRSVGRAHTAGVRVVPWTANAPSDWARLARADVDGIITDDPAGLIAFLREAGLREPASASA